MSSIMFLRTAAAMLLSLMSLACHADDAATAAAVHVCVDARGHVAYQSMPCADGERTRAVRSYRAQAVDPALAARTREIEREMDQRNRGASTSRTLRASGSAKRALDPCKAAKAKRKATLDRVGLKRTYDLLSQLDREVWDVCKGF